MRAGGHFVLSESFVHRGVERGPNQANRTLDWITGSLDELGFDVTRRTPMLVLMNAQVDAGPVWRKL